MTSPNPTNSKPAFSRQGKLLLGGVLALAVAAVVVLFIQKLTESPDMAFAGGMLVGLAGFSLLMRIVFSADDVRIQALIDSADSLRDSDFSFTITSGRNDDIGSLVQAYNSMVSTLRAERQNLHQRELMLDTVIQASPLALVLVNDNDHVIYANATARGLFAEGRRFAGKRFLEEVMVDQPSELRDAVALGQDAMISMSSTGDPERFHLSCSEFTLNAREHRLFLLKRLTQELNRQEVATWKKVIRLIGHELNNSLAPISSMAHSAKLLVERGDKERLQSVLDTVSQRSRHLKEFIEGYSRFAKLPTPRIVAIQWDAFFESLAQLQPFVYEREDAGAVGSGDPEQLEQVFINLAKNAAEAGSAPDQIVVQQSRREGGTDIVVSDRGRGMSEEALSNALLPFYSTKRSGSGLGLSLSREIVDAHDGRISIRNRTGGGVSVRLWLPDHPDAVNRSTST